MTTFAGKHYIPLQDGTTAAVGRLVADLHTYAAGEVLVDSCLLS